MLNVLRHESRVLTTALRVARCRHASTVFVPPASVAFTDRRLPPPPKIKPESPNTYTGRSGFYDAVDDLEKAIQFTRNALKNLQLLPLPKFALQALPPHQPVWKNKRVIGDIIGTTMTPSRYARIRSLLEQLDEYKRIATVAGYGNLADTIANVLELFEREDKAAYLARGQSKPVPIDELGRSYAVGRRKESAARVWVIPVKLPEAQAAAPVVQGEASLATAGEGPLSNLPGSMPLTPAFHKEPTPVVPTSQILINNTPLVEYFHTPADRERVIRPLKIAGVLGAFNVFAIVRGGGTTGQSGAVSLGLAKGVAAHVPEVLKTLRKAKLLRRDPRMVERKKPGLAKARKAYAWVKR